MAKWQWGETKWWQDRAKAVASRIAPNSSVLDLGSGYNKLAEVIQAKLYVAVDAVAHVGGTVVADLNTEYPDLGQHFDYVVVQGLIEYLDQPEVFLQRIKKYGDNLIITYLSEDSKTLNDFGALLARNGWRVVSQEDIEPEQRLYVCTNTRTINAFWGLDKNVGDTLTPVIIEQMTGYTAQYVDPHTGGKLIMCGSLLEMMKPGDIILGAGYNKLEKIQAPEGVCFLAVRGPLTRGSIVGAEVPEVYGDPALLLPLIYKPASTKKYKVGVVPHYADKLHVEIGTGETLIDIEQPWQSVIDQITACEKVVSSSLHGVIIAEAYGIPAQWAVYGDRIHNAQFKFQDYFAGTDRPEQQSFTDLDTVPDISKIQSRLTNALSKL